MGISVSRILSMRGPDMRIVMACASILVDFLLICWSRSTRGAEKSYPEYDKLTRYLSVVWQKLEYSQLFISTSLIVEVWHSKPQLKFWMITLEN
jgi:hypothetical protein